MNARHHTVGREAEFVFQRRDALAHAQQAYKTGVVLAGTTPAQASSGGVQIRIQVAATLQGLNHGVGGGRTERAVLRRGAHLGLRHAVVEFDGLFGGYGDGLAVEHLQLNLSASGGLDDFIFVDLVARFDLAHLAIRTHCKGFAGNGDDGSNLGHGVSPWWEK